MCKTCKTTRTVAATIRWDDDGETNDVLIGLGDDPACECDNDDAIFYYAGTDDEQAARAELSVPCPGREWTLVPDCTTGGAA
jgi:hypothetical protein